MAVLALLPVGVAVWGLTRVPTGFLPDEDQGYLIVSAQLPDGASKERTDAIMQKISKITETIPGVDHVVTVSGVSILDNMARLANGGVAFVVLKDWDVRGKQKGQDLRSIYQNLSRSLQGVTQAIALVLLPPPIQGIGNVGGFSIQVEIRNGDFDYALLQSLTDAVIRDGSAQSALQRVSTTFRAGAPQLNVIVDRIKAETLGITVGNVFSTLAGYVGSTYAAQFNKFGHVFQVYTQALPDYRASVEEIENLKVRAGNGTMTPIGTVIDIKEVQGPPLISLYNLYPRLQLSAAQSAASVRDRLSTSWTRLARRRCRPEQATSGPRCLTRRGRSARRSTSSSASLYCLSISCSRASTKAGSCRFL